MEDTIRYSIPKKDDAFKSSVEAILDRLKAEQGGSSSPGHPKEPERRRKRRKKDIRTVRKERRQKYFDLDIEEKADRARQENGTLRGQYMKLRREIKRRKLGTSKGHGSGNWDWELSLADWFELWSSCPLVQRGYNHFEPAWKCRGRNKAKDVQVKRLDVDKPYRLDNMAIVLGTKFLSNSSG